MSEYGWLILAALIGGAVLIVLGVVVWPRLRKKDLGLPHEEEIEAVLDRVIFYAVCAAYKMSEWSLFEVGSRLRGVDKKAIADATYDLLLAEPESFFAKVITQKYTRSEFSRMIEDRFDDFLIYFEKMHQGYIDAFEKWRTAGGGDS